MAELIRKEDDLNTGREKLNNAIKAFNETVVEGDSSVEAAQARVDSEGNTYSTLKERLDDKETEFSSQLAQRPTEAEVNAKIQANNLTFKESFPTLNDLQSAYPDGDVFNHVVLADGMIYTWAEGTWLNTQIQANGTGIAPNSIDPSKTTFFEKSRNLFSRYENWTLETDAEGGFIRGPFGFKGRMAVVPVEENTQYYIKNYEIFNSNRFGIATSSILPDFESNVLFRDISLIVAPGFSPIAEYSFTTKTGDNYAFVYVSNQEQEPKLQIEKGDSPTEYIEPLAIPERIVDIGGIKSEIQRVKKDVQRATAVAIEQPITGYPARPHATSVLWIGVNEPFDEVEPFDEWRQTGGFSFFTDFSNYKVGTIPDDWSEKWAINSNTPQVNIDSDGSHLQYQPSTNQLSALAWEKISVVDNSDAEVYLKGKVSSIKEGAMQSILVRGSGAVGSENGYVFSMRGTLSGDLHLGIEKKVNGVTGYLVSQTIESLDPTVIYHQRARIEGNNLKFKMWQDGVKEPNSWILEVADDNFSQSGFVGLYTYMAAVKGYVYKFGVSTGGTRAPKRKLI